MKWIVGTAYCNFVDAGSNVRTIVLSDSTETKARLPCISGTEEEGGNA